MLIYYIIAVLAGFLQIGTIYFLRGNFLANFVYTIPLIILFQFMFLWNYSNAPKFTIIWFVTVAITSSLSFVAGHYLYHDQISTLNIIGVLFVVAGVVLLNIK